MSRRVARTVVAVLVAFGLLSAVGATVYSLLLEPNVERALAGPSRLQVTVLRQGEFVPKGLTHTGVWLFPEGTVTPAQLPPALRDPYASAVERGRWAHEHGAVAGSVLALRLSVRARDDTPVILHGLRVDLVSRTSPLSGWFLAPDVGCGGQPVRSVQVDLDEDPVQATTNRYDEARGTWVERPFDLTLRVSETDPEVYEVHARSLAHHVRFRLTLLYESESGPGELTVNDGEPFAVTALTPGRALAYDQPMSGGGSAAALERSPGQDPLPGGEIGLC